MISGVDDLKCAGCGEPLPVDAETTEARLYRGEDGLLVADITCRCGALTYHPMPGMVDELKHRGCKLYPMVLDADQELYEAAAKAGVPIMSIAGMSLDGPDSPRKAGARELPGVVFFVQGDEDPNLARDEERRLIDELAEGQRIEDVLEEFAVNAA